MNEHNEHPCFFRPESIMKHNLDRINLDPHLITDNKSIDDNRPYHYQKNTQVQQNPLINFDNENRDNETNNEDILKQQEINNENIPQQQHENENYNEDNQLNESNTNEYNTQESTISAQNTSQAGTSTNTRYFRVPTRVVSQTQDIFDPQPSQNTLQNRNITFNLPLYPDENTQNETQENTQNETQDIIQENTQHVNSIRNTSVKVSSPTRNTSDSPRYMTRSRYDPPSIPSAFQSNRSIQLNDNHNDNQPTSSRYYNPFNYSFFPSSNNNNINNNNNNNTNNNPKYSQSNLNSRIQNPPINTQPINSSRNDPNSQTRATSYTTSYSHTTQPFQRRHQNPPLTHIPTDPLYQINQNKYYNPSTNQPPVNTAQPITHPNTQAVSTPVQYIPVQHDTFMNMSASIPEPMKPFDGLDHSYTPEEYLQQVEARLTFAIGEGPLNNPIKYRSWHNRRMAYIQCSLTGTALDWYTNLHISYKQQWNSFVQLFKKQFSSQKTAHYAQVEAMPLMKKDNETVRHFALRVQQLVKKGWCNENAATINLKNDEILTKGLPKKLKDFAHKRQVKDVTTLLEPSIPFHTLVRHVDSEDIANEKIRTNYLALEINKVSLEDETNTKISEHEEHIMVTQSGEPNNKSKPAYKKYCSYCHKNNHGISNCYQKQRDDEYQRNKNQRSRTPQQTFVQYFRSKPNNSQEAQNENINTYSSNNNDRNKYNQNYYNDRYRNNNRYRSNSRDFSQNNYRSNSRPRYYNTSRSPYRSRYES